MVFPVSVWDETAVVPMQTLIARDPQTANGETAAGIFYTLWKESKTP